MVSKRSTATALRWLDLQLQLSVSFCITTQTLPPGPIEIIIQSLKDMITGSVQQEQDSIGNQSN